MSSFYGQGTSISNGSGNGTFNYDELLNKPIKNLRGIDSTPIVFLELEPGNYTFIGNYKFSQNDEEAKINNIPRVLQIYKDDIEALELKRQTYSEILNYLKDNSELFDSNFVLTSLNLQSIIDKINSSLNPNSNSINIGKIVIIILVCIFFILIPRLTSLLLYRIFITILSRHHNTQNQFKEQFLAAIRLPVFTFFIIS